MKNVLATVLLALCSDLTFGADEAIPPSPEPTTSIRLQAGAAPASQELISTLAQLDQQLFDAAFGCKLDVLPTLVTDDLEFFHDKSGQTASSGEQFVDQITQGCERQKAGSDFKARRELVTGSMMVYVLNNYGAMQMGTHRFFALQSGSRTSLPKPASSSICGETTMVHGSWRA